MFRDKPIPFQASVFHWLQVWYFTVVQGSQSVKSEDYRSLDCSSFSLTLPKIFSGYWILIQYKEIFAALYYHTAGTLPTKSICALHFVSCKLACCPYWMLTHLGVLKDIASYNNGLKLHNKNECFSYKN